MTGKFLLCTFMGTAEEIADLHEILEREGLFNRTIVRPLPAPISCPDEDYQLKAVSMGARDYTEGGARAADTLPGKQISDSAETPRRHN